MIQSKMRLQGILRTKAPEKGLFTLKQDDSNLAHDVAKIHGEIHKIRVIVPYRDLFDVFGLLLPVLPSTPELILRISY